MPTYEFSDAIDENSLSSEDLAYYTEVMTRCTQSRIGGP